MRSQVIDAAISVDADEIIGGKNPFLLGRWIN
jgi:hypothetical protein